MCERHEDKLMGISAEKALNILTNEILGQNFYIVDPVNQEQANEIIVGVILNKFKELKRKKRFKLF